MTANIIDGRAISEQILTELAPGVASLKARGIKPSLAVILVGDNPSSASYVRSKERACEKVGISSVVHRLPDTVKQKELIDLVKKLNADKSVHGILVQLPLPKHIGESSVIEAISSVKDVDGFSPLNMGRLLAGQDCFAPCTPLGIIELLNRSGYSPEGKHVVIIGRSNIVGKPLAALLLQKKKGMNATVTICHSATKNLAGITKQADILVVAVGRPGFAKADMVKPGSVVIDVGMNSIPDAASKSGHRLVGDVDFERVKEVAGAMTPVPGGVGLMTVAMLISNTVKAAENSGQ